MTSGVLKCLDGDVLVSTDGAPLCSGTWTLVPVPEPFNPLTDIDPAHASLMFSIGFFLFIPVWFTGMCAKAVLDMLK
ncbi:hypothetical protein [Pseudomonas tohonis]|uniref:hypothetical protein n=1 Tax=Pseudomonas tohonis TaxID=2725477 RepID=UPI00255BFFEB|nr:hypothetical protein [Pseudomonas tohonis]